MAGKVGSAIVLMCFKELKLRYPYVFKVFPFAGSIFDCPVLVRSTVDNGSREF